MPEFVYTARDHAGQDVTGAVTAASRREALALLAGRSLVPLALQASRPAAPWAGQFSRPRRVKTEALAATLTQLADLLENGVALLPSLKLLAEQATSPRLREVMQQVHDQVAEGEGLDGALARYPQVFSELTISMVRAGMEGAFLEDALRRTADFLELHEEMKGRVVNAMAYPAFLAVAGFCVTAVLILFFVPKFEAMFQRLEQSGAGLPLATIILLGLSDLLTRYGVLIIAALFGLLLLVKRYLATEAGQLLLDRWKLKLPVAGPIFHHAALARFCRVLGTLLRNGVPILRALRISSASTGNRLLAGAIVSAADNVSSGESLSAPLADSGLVPKPVMAMIRVAEESNTLDSVLINVADRVEKRIERQLGIMVRLVEPVMLVVIGGVVLFILVALLLPVFEMSTTIG